ncbi:hypothetical protein T10_7289 [Trichinella papuae]|uniref:Uncharacterized protein n=1 Tax=Trichinella papuae TaxID=268474 RepID=A0A0V1MW36_9BILA|nr:hypothetical protein T10_7289 [Trichinella papuae]
MRRLFANCGQAPDDAWRHFRHVMGGANDSHLFIQFFTLAFSHLLLFRIVCLLQINSVASFRYKFALKLQISTQIDIDYEKIPNNNNSVQI